MILGSLLLLTLSSCTITDDGEFKLTWLFWAILGAIVILFIAAVNSEKPDENKKKEQDRLWEERRDYWQSKSEIRVTPKSYQDNTSGDIHSIEINSVKSPSPTNVNNIVQVNNIEDDEDELPFELPFEVAGLFYRDIEGHAAARLLEKGDTLILRAEKNNPYDKNAVQVFTIQGILIGYVPKLISKIVKENLSHLENCEVTSVSLDDIPHVRVIASFDEGEYTQPEFIPEELQLSAEDRMRDLTSGKSRRANFWQVDETVRGTFEESPEAIARAKALKMGDQVILKRVNPSEFYESRIDVYTTDGVMVGFIDGDRWLFNNLDKLYKAMIVATLNSYPVLSVGSFFDKTVMPDQPPVFETSAALYQGAYPQLITAEKLKRDDPHKALELALPVANRETGIGAKFLCCQCYRNLGDYESERIMIKRILERIETISPENAEISEYYSAKNKLDTMLRRLKTVENKINNSRK